jgi:enolase
LPNIINIRGREILDSQGYPTVEVDVLCDDGSFGRASVPSGASVGKYEALELRDNDTKRFSGKGVLLAIQNINEIISRKIQGMSIFGQKEIDQTLIYLDNTQNKSQIGANAMLGVSLAAAKAGAFAKKVPLFEYLAALCGSQNNTYTMPVPFINIINGGKHGHNNTDIQEYMIIPIGASSFREAMRCGAEIFHKLGEILESRGFNINIGAEGGYTPQFKTNDEAIKIITEAISAAGYLAGQHVFIGLDVAASELINEGRYYFNIEKINKTTNEMIQYYQDIVNKYPILSIEDGLSEDDWAGWKLLTQTLGNKIKLIGDDLFTTSLERLNRGIQNLCANGIIIKPNQVGTLTETINTIKLAQSSGYIPIMSHRSGETEDTFIADFAVAIGAFGIKSGSTSRTERLAKYNQLMRIEERLGGRAIYGPQSSSHYF